MLTHHGCSSCSDITTVIFIFAAPAKITMVFLIVGVSSFSSSLLYCSYSRCRPLCDDQQHRSVSFASRCRSAADQAVILRKMLDEAIIPKPSSPKPQKLQALKPKLNPKSTPEGSRILPAQDPHPDPRAPGGPQVSTVPEPMVLL